MSSQLKVPENASEEAMKAETSGSGSKRARVRGKKQANKDPVKEQKQELSNNKNIDPVDMIFNNI